MTPDELPADMEGLIERLCAVANRREEGAKAEARDCRATPSDREVYAARVLQGAGCIVYYADLRALLKAYQEQRRALERLANKDNEFGSEVQTIADTALNQKGDKL